jgi:CubicO group peptidase (beta-lactamase class C family)
MLLLGPLEGHAVRAEANPLKGLDDYIVKAMREWEIPGLAIAIVKDDKVVFIKGYGVRKLGEKAPVTSNTLFAIGSTSKAFTAAALGMLVDQGKLKWDDQVRKYLPELQFYDPYVTREITVRDLLSHRSGLSRHELIWYGSTNSRAEVLRRVRYARPSTSFRSQFGYQNVMFLAAGKLIPVVMKQSWDDFVKQRIFKPLGMISTNTSIKAFTQGADLATPHARIEGKIQPIPWRNIDNIGPAGSINSTVKDMAQWLRLQLAKGVYNKERLLSSGVIEEMQTPQIVIRYEGTMAKLNPETHFMAYGLGWMLADYRGQKIAHHGGGIDGMTAQVAMMPEKKLGIVILTNMSGQLLPTALPQRIFDAYLGVSARDWSGELHKVIKDAEDLAKTAKNKEEKDHVQGTKPSLTLEKYAGSYRDDLYGEARIVKEKDKLVLHYGPSFVADLEHWHYDTFRAIWRDRLFGKTMVTFRLNARAGIDDVKVSVGAFGDMTLKRAADPASATPTIVLSKEELRKFIGAYECKKPQAELKIELVQDKLKIVQGGSAFTLAAIKPATFKIEGLPVDVFLEFEMAEGKVKSLKIGRKGGPSLTFLPKK